MYLQVPWLLLASETLKFEKDEKDEKDENNSLAFVFNRNEKPIVVFVFRSL